MCELNLSNYKEMVEKRDKDSLVKEYSSLHKCAASWTNNLNFRELRTRTKIVLDRIEQILSPEEHQLLIEGLIDWKVTYQLIHSKESVLAVLMNHKLNPLLSSLNSGELADFPMKQAS